MPQISALAGVAALALSPLVFAPPALAQLPPLPPTLELTYTTYAAGFTTLRLTADLALTPNGYQLSLTYRTVGTIGFFLPGHDTASAEGTWRGDAPAPSEFASEGIWSGRSYGVEMDYPDGAPQVLQITPPQAGLREKVPPALRRNTIDTASAMALLLRRMIEGEGCDLSVRVFDGRRLIAFTARTAGTEILAPTTRSFFHGPAIRCDITGRMLAGFLLSESPAERTRPHNGAVWFAHPIPGLPLLPVRIAFDTKWFTAATMYLTNITAGPHLPPPLPEDLAQARTAAESPRAAAAH
ncbi:MAG TPA: DUF3108 domain-containing protein [Acetobacteraceae bacterium]|nr:DUF3108 domain-containing protein [Acetobacteraceae bacterium]